MTQEEKSLLLKDLCTRSPYRVKMHLETPEYGELIGTLDAVYPTDDRIIVDNLDKAIAHINVRCGGFNIEENKCKPYLRPMSSMTKQEQENYMSFYNEEQSQLLDSAFAAYKGKAFIVPVHCFTIDFLNSHHFDYRGLIPKGLALEAPKDMYK